MPQTETFVVTLPTELAQKIRARVSPEGNFKSENDVILHDLLEADEWNWLPDEPAGESVDQMLQGVPEQLASIDSGEEPTYTLQQVEKHLAARRAAILHA